MPSKQQTTETELLSKITLGGQGETWHSTRLVSCWTKTIQHLGKLAFILKVSMYNDFYSRKVSQLMRNVTSCCWCMSFQNKIPVCGWCERREAFTQWVATTAFTGFTGLTGKYSLMINNEATVLSREARRRTLPPPPLARVTLRLRLLHSNKNRHSEINCFWYPINNWWSSPDGRDQFLSPPSDL